MKPEFAVSAEQELDLREILAALRFRWRLIAIFAFGCAFIFGYYAVKVAEPKFESVAIFELTESGGSSGLEAISPLAGFLAPSSLSRGRNINDMVGGRNFILEVSQELGLEQDPFFNKTLLPPGGLGLVLMRLGISEPSPITQLKVDATIVAVFRDHLDIGETDDGATIIRVRHTNPETAAIIVNTVMQKIIKWERETTIKKQRSRVEYLSGELAAAQLELDTAILRVQNFAIDKNLASSGELLIQSQQLVRLRNRKEEAVKRLEGLAALEALLSGPNPDEQGLNELLKEMPQLTDRDVLILLQDPRSPEQWLGIAPAVRTQAQRALDATLARVERSLSVSEQEAALTAESAAELNQLEREVKVATATYEVITQQFKEQSLLSGFELSEPNILETAVPALEASVPRRAVIVVLGFLLGVFAGCGVALYLFVSRGTIHSQRALRSTLGHRGRVFSQRFRPRSRERRPKALLRWARGLSKASQAPLVFALNAERAPIVILPQEERDAASLAFLVADHVSGPKARTLIIDLAGQLAMRKGEAKDGYVVQTIEPHLDAATPKDSEHISPKNVASPEFLEGIKAFMADYDRQILVLPPLRKGGYVLDVLGEISPLVVTSAQLGRVRSRDVQSVMSLLPELNRGKASLFMLC